MSINIETYPTLYAKTVNGLVQIWKMEQDGAYTRTVSGKLNGAEIFTDWQESFPTNHGKKNFRDGIAQAKFEIEAAYTKKKKLKYFDSIDDIDNETYFQPMLANEFIEDYVEKGKSLTGLFLVQIKFNGIRCIAKKNGLFTRTGERIVSVPHISKQLVQFFEEHPDSFLDGELYNYDLRERLNEISSLCRQEDPTIDDLEKSENLIQYWIYDGSVNKDLSIPYSRRFKNLNEAVYVSGALTYPTSIKWVSTIMANSKEEIDGLLENAIRDKQEGIMIRFSNSPYEHKRSNHLYKYKRVTDEEFTLMYVEEGKGDWAGKAKKIGLRTNDGRTFRATFKGDMAQAEAFLKDHSAWIGNPVTIQYRGLTGKGLGLPNSAQFDINNQKEYYVDTEYSLVIV